MSEDKLPQISGRQMGRVLLQLGFVLRSEKGSHVKFIRMRGNFREIIIVPDHKILKKGTLNGILKRLRLSKKDLKNLL